MTTPTATRPRSAADRIARQLLRVEDASRALLAVEQGRAPADAPRALSWHYDWQSALVYGSRSALTFLALAAFWLATGHEGLGITTAPGTGRLLADLLLKRPTEIPATCSRRRAMASSALEARW